MLSLHACRNGRLVTVDVDQLKPAAAVEPSAIETPEAPPAAPAPDIVWMDLLNPSPADVKLVEARLGIEIPTRAEMAEIELSNRLYSEDGAEFMTMTAIVDADGEPTKSALTFILKGDCLVTVRHADSRPFAHYMHTEQRGIAGSATSGEHVMMGLLEAIIDRVADVLERVGDETDAISRGVFRNKRSNVTKKTGDLQSLIEQIGAKGDLLSKLRESLISIGRLAAYHNAAGAARPAPAAKGKAKAKKEARERLKLIQRDAASLAEHAVFLSSKMTFLLDATLGLINLEQNQIIKIFSVAAVVFLPPTLVASIYGMNFEIMPELKWTFGYPYALCLMVASAIVPYLFFKRKGWL